MKLPKILIADDAKINRNMLAVIFEGIYEIYEAADGQQAIDMVDTIENLDLLLLDLNMPKKTGFDVLDYLRKNDRMKELPVIIVTSSSEEEDELLAFEKGASEIVRKPFVPKVILRRVKNLIELYSSRKQLQKKLVERTNELEYSKKYDDLTGFLSRQEFFSLSQKLLENAEDAKAYTVLYTNIRNFKYYNVKNGMEQGDNVLRALAEIMKVNNSELFGRIGQDHLAAITKESQEKIREYADKIVEQFDRKFGKYGMLLNIGTYSFDKGEVPINVAVEYAKLACDVIRDKVDHYCEYDEELKRKLEVGTYVLQHIDEAIEKRYIQVYYQPVMRTINNKVCGMEALARWIDPVMGFLSPADFIPTLEENHMIAKLDFCVLKRICEDINTFARENRTIVPVSFNLSRNDFLEYNVFEEVEKIVQQAGVPRDFINIEVTETAFTENKNELLEDITKLRSVGYQVWMDDFGSGYSSLNVLKDYPFDEIKLDMIFMRSFDEKSKNIVTTIIDMAKKLGIQTLAEGVETEEQYNFLRSIGCEKIQGYYLSKPLGFDAIKELVIENNDNLEKRVWKHYYDQVGKISFTAETSFALLEWDGNVFDYLYVNPKFTDVLESIGIFSIQEMEMRLNTPTSLINEIHLKMIEGIQVDSKQKEFIYTLGDQYVRSTLQCIAKQDKKMILRTSLLNLSGIETGDQRTVLDHVGRQILGLYEMLIYTNLDTGKFDVIRTGDAKLEDIFRAENMKEAILRYAELIHPAEQKEYLSFANFETLKERIEKEKKFFITKYFRTRVPNGAYIWKMFTILYISDSNMAIYGSRVVPLTEEGTIQKADVFNDNKNLKNWIVRSVLNSNTLNMFWKDKNRRFVGANRGFLETYGFQNELQILGKTDEDMGWHVQNALFYDDEKDVLDNGAIIHNHIGTCIIKGVVHNIMVSKEPIYEEGEIVGLSGCFFDLDTEEQSQTVQKVERKDPMTDLLSPYGLMNYIAGYEDERMRSGREYALIHISIPEYERCKKFYGDSFARKLLRQIGNVIVEIVGVKGTCARIYAANFVVLMCYETKDEIHDMTNEIMNKINQMHEFMGHAITFRTQTEAVYSDEEDLFEYFIAENKLVFSSLVE